MHGEIVKTFNLSLFPVRFHSGGSPSQRERIIELSPSDDMEDTLEGGPIHSRSYHQSEL